MGTVIDLFTGAEHRSSLDDPGERMLTHQEVVEQFAAAGYEPDPISLANGEAWDPLGLGRIRQGIVDWTIAEYRRQGRRTINREVAQ